MTEGSSPQSPDFLSDFDHTVEMEDGVHLIENADEARRRNNLLPLFVHDGVPVAHEDVQMTPPPRQERDEETWVVFIGRVPGVYPLL